MPFRENVFEKFVEESKIAGFDIIEISENNIHLSIEEKKKITKILKSHESKAPVEGRQKGPTKTIDLGGDNQKDE